MVFENKKLLINYETDLKNWQTSERCLFFGFL